MTVLSASTPPTPSKVASVCTELTHSVFKGLVRTKNFFDAVENVDAVLQWDSWAARMQRLVDHRRRYRHSLGLTCTVWRCRILGAAITGMASTEPIGTGRITTYSTSESGPIGRVRRLALSTSRSLGAEEMHMASAGLTHRRQDIYSSSAYNFGDSNPSSSPPQITSHSSCPPVIWHLTTIRSRARGRLTRTSCPSH